MLVMNSLTGNGERVSRAMASSIPNRNVRMMMRALTSQASHNRSSNMECISDPDCRYSGCSFAGTSLAEKWNAVVRAELVHPRGGRLGDGEPARPSRRHIRQLTCQTGG